MKVFISWSGTKSKVVAKALTDYIPDVLHEAEPWMSQHDIEAGQRWGNQISESLASCQLGILCLTASNKDERWILFEAGALSKTVDSSRVIPLLIDFPPAELNFPLAQFQAVLATKDGLRSLLGTLNKASIRPVEASRLERLLEKMWPDFEAQLREAETQSQLQKAKPLRPERELLTETLELVRGISHRLQDGDALDDQAGHIEIDTRLFFGDDGKVSRIKFLAERTVSRFLDDIFLLLNRQGHVGQFTYGEQWLLKNTRTNEVYSDVGIEYCKSRGRHEDDTPVYTLGIDDGDRLLVIGPEDVH